jgi:hypothetical protein
MQADEERERMARDEAWETEEAGEGGGAGRAWGRQRERGVRNESIPFRGCAMQGPATSSGPFLAQ